MDMCPQANLSETLLGGHLSSPKAMAELGGQSPRATIAGYIEARLSSPFSPLKDVSPYISSPNSYNHAIPSNLYLICGDNLLEVLSEAIRQTSQLALPDDAWARVESWLKDLAASLRARSGDRDSLFLIDCNPSFAIYTQLALVAADYLVVPFTSDDSSRRAIENVVALLYGLGDPEVAMYAKISFAKRARDEGIEIPKLHTFVSNRVTLYRGSASSAFEAVTKTIKETLDNIYKKHRSIFASPSSRPSATFKEVPDYHSACIVASMTGTPLHRLKAGPKTVAGERVQINPEPLEKYKAALAAFVDSL